MKAEREVAAAVRAETPVEPRRLEIRLLGSPQVLLDGTARPAPRGHKAWGLLAYLLLRESPPARSHVAELLFPGAEDPLAALRWSLSQLRRLVGDPKAFRGDPIEPGRYDALGPPAVDVVELRSAGVDRAADFGQLGQELLAGTEFPGCAAFELWLQAQRRQAKGAAESLLHEAAHARLGAGDAEEAAELAGRLVALDPYDENNQTLLVRSLAAAGHGIDAARQAAACRELFRSELGIEPGPALDAAVRTTTATSTTPAATGRPAVQALVEAGEAAIAAGALTAGLECLRRAAADAETLGDGPLRGRTLLALGTALVHAARGGDEEGTTALHRALTLPDAGPGTAARALAELAYVEFLRGRYDRAERLLARAGEVPGERPVRAVLASVRGSTLSDRARYPEALAALRESAGLATDDRRRAYALSMTGRVHLLCGRLDEAVTALDEALGRSQGWTAFLPWPEALRAEADLARGDVDGAEARLEHAFALGCQIGDPCWEGLAARGLGLVRAARGDVEGAVEWLTDARRRAARLPDGYVWVEGHVLDALADVGVRHDLPGAGGWIADLAALAGRRGMAELTARAALHRWRAGDPAALAAARELASSIDNPALHDLLRD